MRRLQMLQQGPDTISGGTALSHQKSDISGDTIVDWSPAFALVPSIEVAYAWHAGVHAAAVAEGLVRLGLDPRSSRSVRRSVSLVGARGLAPTDRGGRPRSLDLAKLGLPQVGAPPLVPRGRELGLDRPREIAVVE